MRLPQTTPAVVSVILVALAAGASAVQPAAAKRAWALPGAARGAVSAAIGRDDPSYRVRESVGLLRAANHAQGLRISFSRAGVSVAGRRSPVAVALEAVGRGGTLRRVGDVAPRATANRVVYRRPGLTEWYANGPLGLEQGFDVRTRPAARGPLTLALGLRRTDARLDPGSASVTFGASGLRYSGLVAADARGRALRAWLELRGRTLLVRVDDRDARYPVRIDPFFEVAKLTASDGQADDSLGISVAASGDVVVAGASAASAGTANVYPGAVYVFEKPVGGWSGGVEEVAKLTASDGADGDGLGFGVAIDGDTIVAGAPGATVNGDPEEGAVYVFEKPIGGWATGTETAKLTGSGITPGEAPDLGYWVGISGDTVVAGAPFVDGELGAAYVFVKPGADWVDETQTAKLTASDGVTGDHLGASVAISGDTVVAGAPDADVGTNVFQGKAYVFVKPGAAWIDATETQQLTASDGAELDGLGYPVAISPNGTIAVGALGAVIPPFGEGAVYLFTNGGGGWSQVAKLTGSDSESGDGFAFGLALTDDTVVVGSPFAFFNGMPAGLAYVYAEPGGGWVDATEDAQLAASDAFPFDGFGFAAAISNDTVFVGAPPGCGCSFASAHRGFPSRLSRTTRPATADPLAGAVYAYPDRPASVTILKQLKPVPDTGRFDLLVDSTVVKSAAGTRDRGTLVLGVGTHTVSEEGSGGTDLADYASSIACTKNGGPDVSGAGTSIQVSVALGDVESCLILNRRKATITLREASDPSADAGRFDLHVGATAVATSVGDGGSGTGSFVPGTTYTIAETDPGPGSLDNYTSSIDCTRNGGAGPSASGSKLEVAVAAGDALDCTFTNVRKPVITVRNSLRPRFDPGDFQLTVDGSLVNDAAGTADSGYALVAAGGHTVGEAAAAGTDLADYTSSISCTKNGAADVSGAGTSLAVNVDPGDRELCTVSNLRRDTVTLHVASTPSSDPGRFDLVAGFSKVATAVGDGGSGTGSLRPGRSYTVAERAALGSLSNYVKTYDCTLNGGAGPSGSGGSFTYSAGIGEVLDCTFTNVRKARIGVRKSLRPQSDPGRFQLLVDSTVVNPDAGGTSSGGTRVPPGTHTVSELALTGTDLADYTTSISCTKNGSPDVSGPGTTLDVDVDPADVELCKISNVRNP